MTSFVAHVNDPVRIVCKNTLSLFIWRIRVLLLIAAPSPTHTEEETLGFNKTNLHLQSNSRNLQAQLHLEIISDPGNFRDSQCGLSRSDLIGLALSGVGKL